MKKTIFALAIVLIGTGFSYAPTHAKEKAKVVIKLATMAPRDSNPFKVMAEFRDKVREATHNEVDFKIYAGGVQGDDNDVLRKIRLKQLHGGIFTGSALGRIVPSVRVTGIPFVFSNDDEVSYVRSKLEDTLNKQFEDAGFIALGWNDIGFAYLFSREPITSLEILKKQKVWVWGDDPVMIAFYESLGVSPIPLSVTDVLASLSSNLIDTAPTTPFGAVALRWHTKFKYMNALPLANVNGAVVVRKEIWDKISHESQSKIKEMAKHHFKKITKTSIETDKESIEVLKKAGISIVHFRDSQKNIEEVGKKTRESLIGRLYSRELLDRTLALVEEYKKHHHDKTYTRIE
jgi:TRAP-type C4-dicarboxylate transport system substrate-binding protein